MDASCKSTPKDQASGLRGEKSMRRRYAGHEVGRYHTYRFGYPRQCKPSARGVLVHVLVVVLPANPTSLDLPIHSLYITSLKLGNGRFESTLPSLPQPSSAVPIVSIPIGSLSDPSSRADERSGHVLSRRSALAETSSAGVNAQ